MDDFERKQFAMMFTDIFGYSRLMSLDENKALKMLSEHDRIVDGIITSHHGRILKKMGDAVFAVFESPVDALNCAITIQNQLKTHNDSGPLPGRILIRIGLHKGDVVTRDNDLFGEDVNAMRMAGIFVIIVGVVLVAAQPHLVAEDPVARRELGALAVPVDLGDRWGVEPRGRVAVHDSHRSVELLLEGLVDHRWRPMDEHSQRWAQHPAPLRVLPVRLDPHEGQEPA